MSDVARLGLAIDSSQATQAATALGQLGAQQEQRGEVGVGEVGGGDDARAGEQHDIGGGDSNGAVGRRALQRGRKREITRQGNCGCRGVDAVGQRNNT